MWTKRKSQIEPAGNWLLWLIMAGRGFGKTRTGSETIRIWIESNKYKNIGFIGYSDLEVRKIMIEGVSGILSVSQNRALIPVYEPSKKLISYENGAKIHLFSADNPNQLRGFELDAIWIDEFAKFKDSESIWHQSLMTLRKSKIPKIICTTTPKPIRILRNLVSDKKNVVVTKGSTYDNAENLSPFFLSMIKDYYHNTKFAQQEIYGEILDIGDEVFDVNMIKNARYNVNLPNNFDSIVLGVDPAVSSTKNSDESGMIVVGKQNNTYYVLEDASGKYSPVGWANKIVEIYKKYKCTVVIETNNGGDFLSNTVHMINSNIKIINKRAVDSKIERAYSISMMYSQNKIKHAREFVQLHDQMLNYKHCKSPDRIDALIWAIEILSTNKKKLVYTIIS